MRRTSDSDLKQLEKALETMSDEEILQRMAEIKLEMDATAREQELVLQALARMDPETAAQLSMLLPRLNTQD